MFKSITRFFDSNERALNKYRQTVVQINELEPEYETFSDEQISQKTQEFKDRLKDGETLDDLLVEAFALVREASKRTLGLRHYDVQLMAGIAFHEGNATEQRTGEGKTLSATSALYLNALEEKGVHLVTVNDYLAQRDAGWNSQLFDLLGMSVGVVYSGKGDQPAAVFDPEYEATGVEDQRLLHLKPVDRKEAYEADVTYGTNNEFGFDYLRDNMAQSVDKMVQRGHHYAIVDEVDSILIDEARTPLIISAPDTEPTKRYYDFAKLVGTLSSQDYTLDEKQRTVTLTEYGLRRLERRLNVNNLYEDDYDAIHHVEQALKAKTLFHRDKNYVVKDGEVIIVDENTGRMMYGRRYSEGLHQAIEAKEGVTIQQESRTLATVSLQNYFRLYNKLAGMTGTAETEAEEFSHIYNMDVVVIPTNKPVARIDHPDVVYKTQRAKYSAIVREVQEKNEKGQPVLIGTKNIEQNEILARFLKRMKVPHQLLNAKNHAREASIIADAGKPSGVTVATNIAGRGVDIVLGGAPPEKPQIKKDHPEYDARMKKYREAHKEWQKLHDLVLKNGGLHVIGFERHDSRRIDNQLRGRSGRQGDPGSSRFFVSLEDDLMRIFGGEQVSKLMTMLKIPEDQPIESGMVSKSIEQAQTKVEGFHFDQRKRLVEYDDVMNKQREIIYKRRYQILKEAHEKSDETGLKERILNILDDQVTAMVMTHSAQGLVDEERSAIMQELLSIIPFDKPSHETIAQKIQDLNTPEEVINTLQEIVHKTYKQRENQVGPEIMRQFERYVMLSSIDRMWMSHLDAMDSLRDGIWMRGGKDQVLSEYKKEAFDMFETLLSEIDDYVAKHIFRIQQQSTQQATMPTQVTEQKKDILNPQDPQAQTPQPTVPTGSTASLASAMSNTAQKSGSMDGRNPTIIQVDPKAKKIGRNDPCPCGAVNSKSGKPYKYKKCGMINAPHHQGPS